MEVYVENPAALAAIILIVLAVIYVERTQRGTYIGLYGKNREGKNRNGKSPEKDPAKPAGPAVGSRLAPLLSLLLPGTGRLYRGQVFRGIRYASVGVFCWFSIGISLVKGIEALGVIFAALLLLITFASSIQAGCRK